MAERSGEHLAPRHTAHRYGRGGLRAGARSLSDVDSEQWYTPQLWIPKSSRYSSSSSRSKVPFLALASSAPTCRLIGAALRRASRCRATASRSRAADAAVIPEKRAMASSSPYLAPRGVTAVHV